MKKLTAIFLCMLMLAVLPGSLTGVLPFATPARPVQCCRAEAASGVVEATGSITFGAAGSSLCQVEVEQRKNDEIAEISYYFRLEGE